jgi:hypothetical protein
MRRQRRLMGAHGPDVQIVHLQDAVEPGQIVPDIGKLDAARHGIQREVEAVARQAPAARGDDESDAQAHRGIDPEPAGDHDHQRRGDHAKRHAGVGRHVQIGAADIEIAVAAAHEHQRGATIDENTKRRNPDHGRTRHHRRLAQTIDRFDRDAADRDQQQTGIEQRGQDRRAPIAIGMRLRRPPARQPGRAPCEQQRDHVGQIVDGVRDQRQRIGGVAKGQFGKHERRIERCTQGERDPEAIRRVAVPGVAMRVAVIMIMMMVSHLGDNRRLRGSTATVIATAGTNTITLRLNGGKLGSKSGRFGRLATRGVAYVDKHWV